MKITKHNLQRKTPKTSSKKSGQPPGTLVYTGQNANTDVKITLFTYKGDFYMEKNMKQNDDFNIDMKPEFNYWLNIDGIHNIDVVSKIGNHFNIHPLILEDITHNIQRPKLENYDNYLYFVIRNLSYNEDTMEVSNEQISIILGSNYIVSFNEDTDPTFENVRERLQKGGPKMRNGNCGYLAYALIDSIVDNYFLILEKMGEDIEELEDVLISNPGKNDLQKVHRLRSQLILLRKSVWPLREVLNNILRENNNFISEDTIIYLRDVYDHSIQIIETIESYREMVIGMLDVYLSSMSNKMNQIMKVLTIISTIFIPLSFLAGVYGMNFLHFPEIGTIWMYPWGFWGISCIITLTMLAFFKKKNWL